MLPRDPKVVAAGLNFVSMRIAQGYYDPEHQAGTCVIAWRWNGEVADGGLGPARWFSCHHGYRWLDMARGGGRCGECERGECEQMAPQRWTSADGTLQLMWPGDPRLLRLVVDQEHGMVTFWDGNGMPKVIPLGGIPARDGERRG